MHDDGRDLATRLEALHTASFGWALQCARFDAAEAEDLLQATYLKVLDGRARFRGESEFKTWLFAVIRRTAAERRRRERVRRWLLVGRAIDPESASDLPDREFERTSRAQRLINALDTLSERQREVLHLVFYGSLSVEDAARVMGVSVGSARTHYARGKQRLRERLGEEEA